MHPTTLRDSLFTMAFRLNGDDDARVFRMASLLPGFTQEGGVGGRDCRITMNLAEAGTYRDVLLDVWRIVAGFPSASLRLDGEPLTLDGFKDVLEVLDCSGACEASGRGEAFCSAVKSGWDWGCLHLQHVTPRPDPDGNGPDLEELRQRLERTVREKYLSRCPHFDPARTAGLAAAFKARSVSPPLAAPARDSGLPPGPEKPSASPGCPVPETSYADVGGLDAVVRELRECIELPLRHPEVLRRLGIAHHRGALLHGPPGCGKTLLARAVACGSGATFLSVSGPELITKWHGESEERLRALFAEARERQPTVVFFDEIDAIAPSRSADESLRLDSRFTTQLLTLMDGIHDLGRVFVLAATNRMDLLDPALLRVGRLDRIIEVPPPDADGRLAILRIHARGLPLAENVSLEALAGELDGFTGADIAFCVREAAYACLRRELNMETLLEDRAPLAGDVLQGLNVAPQDFARALDAARARRAAVEERTRIEE